MVHTNVPSSSRSSTSPASPPISFSLSFSLRAYFLVTLEILSGRDYFANDIVGNYHHSPSHQANVVNKPLTLLQWNTASPYLFDVKQLSSTPSPSVIFVASVDMNFTGPPLYPEYMVERIFWMYFQPLDRISPPPSPPLGVPNNHLSDCRIFPIGSE